MSRKPDLFIIGAAKCGTTSLYEYLRGHPEIFMSRAKEPRYFAPDLAVGTHGHDLNHPHDETRYLALFSEARDEKRLGEASVRYIYSQQAPELIAEFQPRPYIIAMIRNPIDMMYSMHNQRVSEGHEDIADFEEALAAEEDRRAGRRIPAGSNSKLSIYRDRARFSEQLQRWFDRFGRERVHVIVFEDMIADPPGIFRRVLEFLEVDPEYQPETFSAYNKSHAPRSRLLRSLTRSRVPQWIVWSLLPRVVGDRVTRGMVRGFRHSPLNRKPAPRTPLRPELRTQLEAEFSDEVERTGEMLGRDLLSLWFKRDRPEARAAGEAVLTK
jgi:hypothetical protein